MAARLKFRWVGIICFTLIARSGVALSSEPTPLPSGAVAPTFQMRDVGGRLWSSRTGAGRKGLVVAFLGAECPLAATYTTRLTELHQRWASKGISFVGVFPNIQDSLREVAEFARQRHVTFTVVKDPQHRLADQFGAVRTPEVFLLDSENRVRYWGRIDDQFAISVQREQPRRRDLVEAMRDVVANRDVRAPRAPSVGCHIGRLPTKDRRREVSKLSSSSSSSSSSSITYWQHVRPLIGWRCLECHYADGIAPLPLETYDEVSSWALMIKEVVQEGRMPPWLANPDHGVFANDARLSPDERRTLLEWIDGGCVEGDAPKQKCTTVHRTTSSRQWRMSEPDVTLSVSEQPFPVPATGALDYAYFVIETNFAEDRFIAEAEVMPGQPSVVHHALVSMLDGDSPLSSVGNLGVLINYAPGMQPTRLARGQGIRLPANAKLLVQMHYTPNGIACHDQTRIGLRFIGRHQVRQEVTGAAIANPAINIPPLSKRHPERAEIQLSEDILLLSMSPHLHLRGRSFRYVAVYPDRQEEVLLDVPRYDYNWQLRYQLAEPKRLPKGTKIVCLATFDNSWDNLANPDPTRAVGWGDRTKDEMLIGFIAFAKERRMSGSVDR